MKAVQAVIFDLDGVITDTAEYHYAAWKQLGESIGIDFNREFNETLKGISRMDSLNRILAFGGKQDVYTMAEKEELAEQKNRDYVALLVGMSPKDIYPGIQTLLDELQDQNIRIALASASKNAPMILQSLALTEYFECIVNPNDLQAGKPDPEIFLRAAQALGVEPENCIGVEDAEAGIEAIKAANMFAVGVGTISVMIEAGADYVVKQTNELDLAKISSVFAKKKQKKAVFTKKKQI
ncbi:MAG: beta-phosphoglucomutase [Culicoidibacterales bacterium]